MRVLPSFQILYFGLFSENQGPKFDRCHESCLILIAGQELQYSLRCYKKSCIYHGQKPKINQNQNQPKSKMCHSFSIKSKVKRIKKEHKYE